MKRTISALLSIMILISLFAVFNITATAIVPTAEDMGGYENLCLTYTFRTSNRDYGRHYKNDLMPYTAYLDKNGNIKDFFFDSYLFLPCMDFGPSGARMHVDVNNPTKAIDWTTYVEDTFHKGANVDALEEAFGATKKALGDSEKKAGAFFTILYPCTSATNFGTLGGKQLNFSKMEDRKYAVKWIIDEQMKLFNERNYQNIELVGFYWLEEFVLSNADKELFQYASEYLHSMGLKFIWIPWYKAEGYQSWRSLGFDVACMQPNLFWLGNYDPNRVEESVRISNKYGMGMEMELDSRVTQDDYFYRYLDYLEIGMTSGMMDGVKMYYQDGKPGVYYQACYSNNDRYRTVYDLTYKYAKGTLTKNDISSVRPQLDINYVDDIKFNDNILLSGVSWYSIGKPYTACEAYVDGNGLAYQDVDGKELTDGVIATNAVSTDWHGFHSSLRDKDWRLSVIIDLEEVRNDITNIAAHFDNRMEYGIGTPENILLYSSEDGENYKYINMVDLICDPVNSCINYESSKPITARYIKMSFLPAGNSFVFCSEFLVGTNIELEPNNDISDNTDINDESEIIDGNENGSGNSKDYTVLIITISVSVVLLIAVATFILIKIRRKKNKCN